jgi:hypothetical protein
VGGIWHYYLREFKGFDLSKEQAQQITRMKDKREELIDIKIRLVLMVLIA